MSVLGDPHQIRSVLEKITKDKDTLKKSARLSFEQYDKDHSGKLDATETKKLLNRLCKNMQLPPIEDATFEMVFIRYDDGDGNLTLTEFTRMYYEILLRIRDRYFPDKKTCVRRSFFVGHVSLKDGKGINDVLTFKKKLGSGSFGQVFLVVEKSSNLERVCKIINKDKAQMPVEQIRAEIEFMKTLDHPNIIKIFDVYEDYNSIYLIMEICSGGELGDKLEEARKAGKRLSEKEVATMMMQMIEALCYFHDKKIAHKDLKPENAMFQDKSPGSPLKVIDFGVAEMFESNTVSTQAAGTALYMAPEVWRRCFGMKCDVWSAGCILYFLLTGFLPFNGKNMREVQTKVLYSEPNYAQECRGISAEAIDLIKLMLCKDYHKRPSSRRVLEHRWFANAEDTTSDLSPEVLKIMGKYMQGGEVKRALRNLLTHQLNVDGSKVRSIIQMFKKLDKDKNGCLSHAELTTGLMEAGWNQLDINKITQSLDIDDSGQVNYTEFLTACYSWQEDEINVVWGAFNKMDASGDGQISVGELTKVLSGGEHKHGTSAQIAKTVKEIDLDGNGYVDWDEFLAYMKK